MHISYFKGPHVELPGKISRHKCGPDNQLVSVASTFKLLNDLKEGTNYQFYISRLGCVSNCDRAKVGAGFGGGRILGADRIGPAAAAAHNGGPLSHYEPHCPLSLLGPRGEPDNPGKWVKKLGGDNVQAWRRGVV